MAYLGNTPTQQGFIPAIDFFSGNGSTVAFTLSRPVASVAQVQATIENVPQNPGDAFTVSGNTITFTSAPPSGTNNIYVYYTSPITQVIQPGQGTVGTAQFASGVTVNFADGSAAAPSITNDGDTNTGIFFPAADTIAFSEGGAESMRINSVGNVGIGTDNPTEVVHMFRASGDPAIRIQSAGGSSFFVNRSSGQLDIANAANAALTLWTNNTTRMTIDSSGRVTMPFQPAFSANGANSDTTTTATNPLPFNSLSNGIVNSARSAGYNTSTFRFTAPVAGLYFFAATIFTGSGSSYAQVAPYKNGAAIPTTDQLLLFTTPGAGSEMQTGSFIIDLAVNDYVDIRPRVGYNIRMYGGHSFFTGYLIG
jgi:hypothetical protein